MEMKIQIEMSRNLRCVCERDGLLPSNHLRAPVSGAGDCKRGWKGRKALGLLLKHGYWSEFYLSYIDSSCAALDCLPSCDCNGGSWSFTNSGTMAAKMREVACRKLKTSVFTLMPIDGCWMQGLVADAGLGGGYRGETQDPGFASLPRPVSQGSTAPQLLVHSCFNPRTSRDAGPISECRGDLGGHNVLPLIDPPQRKQMPCCSSHR